MNDLMVRSAVPSVAIFVFKSIEQRLRKQISRDGRLEEMIMLMNELIELGEFRRPTCTESERHLKR